MASLPKLAYFEMRGRAEAVRIMLHAMSVEFEDQRVVEPGKWSELKAQLPFGALPFYQADGLTLSQSHAIFRHLARSFGWMGADEMRDGLLDVSQEALAEAQEELWRFAWVEDYHEKTESYAREQLEPQLGRLEAWFRRDGRDEAFWVGDSLTHVDCIAFCYLDEIDAFFPKSLERFQHLAAFRSRFESLRGVGEYLASERRPIVFGMGIRGPKIDRRRPIPKGAQFENHKPHPPNMIGRCPYDSPNALAESHESDRISFIDAPRTSSRSDSWPRHGARCLDRSLFVRPSRTGRRFVSRHHHV